MVQYRPSSRAGIPRRTLQHCNKQYNLDCFFPSMTANNSSVFLPNYSGDTPSQPCVDSSVGTCLSWPLQESRRAEEKRHNFPTLLLLDEVQRDVVGQARNTSAYSIKAQAERFTLTGLCDDHEVVEPLVRSEMGEDSATAVAYRFVRRSCSCSRLLTSVISRKSPTPFLLD